MLVHGWEMRGASDELVPTHWELGAIERNHVAVEVAACGVCQTDLEYMRQGVGHRRLGHEVAGTVVDAGADVVDWVGRAVVVPPVIPCDCCDLCCTGRARTCAHEKVLGRDIPGGLASHVVVPVRGLCAVDADELAASPVGLADLAALAEAVAVPYQAIVRSRLRENELAVFVGLGETGGFGAQIAAALGAHVVALDVADDPLERAIGLGASHALNVSGSDPAMIRRSIQDHARTRGLRQRWKIYETSHTGAGQELAFELLTQGACLTIVGCTSDDVTVRLSNLAELDATAMGTRGCLSKHLPGALDLILAGDVRVDPLIERRPMSRVNETLDQLRHEHVRRRPLLIPDFDAI